MVTRWLYGYKDRGYMVIWLALLNVYKVAIWLQGYRDGVYMEYSFFLKLSLDMEFLRLSDSEFHLVIPL